MKTPPPHEHESERIADLWALRLLDTPPENRFDRLSRLAVKLFNVPIVYVALVDEDRQWFKSQIGLNVIQTPRSISFCGHAILQNQPLIVPDARQDERFFDNPLVLGEPYIRFYAGYPLRGPNGQNVGTFCIVDRHPRQFDENDRRLFQELAELVEHELNLMDLIQIQRQLLETKNTLLKTQEQLSNELAQAAEYVQSLLPKRLEGEIQSDWAFISSMALGGDIFGYHRLNSGELAFYLVDVCGHGVGASLLSISILHAIRRETLPGVDFREPAEVLAALNRTFPMQEHKGMFFTMGYGTYAAESRRLCYAAAGHPPALLIDPENPSAQQLPSTGLPIGMVTTESYETHTRRLVPGTRFYLFSDGLFEVKIGDSIWDYNGLVETIVKTPEHHDSRVATIVESVRSLSGHERFVDDVSLLELTFG